MQEFISIGKLNEYISALLDADEFLADLWLKGEISGFKHYRQSGHYYFTLKDDNAAVSCVMFKSSNRSLDFKPEDGMEILARGYVSVYSRQGRYQVYIQEMQPFGIGGLFLYLEQLRKKLEKQGYFDPQLKKTIPNKVKCVGIVSSQDGAALQDILRVIRQRHRTCRVIIAHSSVQGQDAPAELARGLKLLNDYGEADVIIIGRGGGSFEDLMAFNSEEVVKAIYDSKIPVISAVGHEVDFTLADLAADLRAATPTQAAVLAVPDMVQIEQEITNLQNRMLKAMERKLNTYSENLDHLMLRKIWSEPSYLLQDKKRMFRDHCSKLIAVAENGLKDRKLKLALAAKTLDSMSPLKVLERGYALVYRDDQIIKSCDHVFVGDVIRVKLYRGELKAEVVSKEMDGVGK